MTDEAPRPVPTETQAATMLKAGATAGLTVPASEPGSSGVNSWIPPRKFLAGGIGGIVAWALIWGLQHWLHFDLVTFAANFGVSIDALQMYIASAVGAALVYIVPPSKADVVKHLNDEIVHAAQKDPDTNVSYVLAPVKPPAGEAATIVPPAAKAA